MSVCGIYMCLVGRLCNIYMCLVGCLCKYGTTKALICHVGTPVTGAQPEEDIGGEVFPKLSTDEDPDTWFMQSV